ncbi:helix-turn-helix transcriptional regulator [Natronomonas halophila]|uniref:helix-turn-helix transcriptional regulator n=1 Tax=Natronomonas halophila TaxID=2747817 RepID=UPI001BAC96D4|nr:hypothetical protein [Natronomonas halophila]
MNRGFVAVVIVFVVVAGVTVPGLAAASTGTAAAPTLQEDINPDDVVMEVDVEADGDAAWRIEYRMRLNTDQDEQAFENLSNDIESDPGPYVERFHNRMNATADSAANATGREMAITNVSVSATREELPQERGVVTFTFRWSNFAATDGDRLLVGDAIDGLVLDENTSLLITWPDEYALLDANPSPTESRDGTASYDGPTNFATGEPRLELGPKDATPADNGLAGSSFLVGGLLVLLVFLLGGLLLVWRRGGMFGVGGENNENDGDGGGGSSPAAAAEDEAEPTPTDPDLLSNEEQVLQLIEQHGGRMKQQAVAEELGWTDAKTSQVTKGLREEGDLEGFRLGRENVLALPDEDITEDADGSDREQ